MIQRIALLILLIGTAWAQPEPDAEPGAEPDADTALRVVGKRPAPAKDAVPAETLQVREEQHRSTDMGELLNRMKGVNFRRRGGLGSRSTINLHGLAGERVRFFLDGLPLQLSAFGQEPTALPVNLIERVEVFKGVVPIRFGVDALGGVVHFITPAQRPSAPTADLAYEYSSFSTHRFSGSTAAPVGEHLTVALSGFADRTRNDYAVDVEIDESGQQRGVTVDRFHDDYAAHGGNLDLIVRDVPWAERLLLRGFAGASERAFQHDNNMVIPYGAARRDQIRWGTALDYRSPIWAEQVQLEALLAFTDTQARFFDLSFDQYDWRGNVVRARRFAGEAGDARRVELYDRIVTARLLAHWAPRIDQRLTLSAAPTLLWRDQDARPGNGDPSQRQRDAQTRNTAVIGLAWQAAWWRRRVESELFAKRYQGATVAPLGPLDGGGEAEFTYGTWGGGGVLRYSLIEGLSINAGYEFATRLPGAGEVFGDGGLVLTNFSLRPETSHNVNLGVTGQWRWGAQRWTAEINGFRRDTTDLIFLVITPFASTYENLASARTHGVEVGARWAWRHHLQVRGNLTWFDARNVSNRGQFERFDGDRIPNLPYWMANAALQAGVRDCLAPRDQLQAFWDLRFVDSFFRFWEGEGRADTKQIIPRQVVQAAGLSYAFADWPVQLTLEARNLTDRRVFDSFGIQRPGRSLHLKVVTHAN